MRRIALVLTVAMLMAAMLMFAIPAFAQANSHPVDVESVTEHIPECVDELVTTGEPGLHCHLLVTAARSLGS